MSLKEIEVTPRYTDKVMEHFVDPYHREWTQSADRVGITGVPGDGPFLAIQLCLQNGIVTHASFQSHNCGVTVACGSVLAGIVEGRSLDQCGEVTTDDLVEALDGIPEDKRHVPEMAISALRMAIADEQGEMP